MPVGGPQLSTPRAIVIGQPRTVEQVVRQLALLADPPRILGHVLTAPDHNGRLDAAATLGIIDDLEAIVQAARPDVALVCLPAAVREQIAAIRTRLRRLGVPDRFMPTLADQLAGVGPRTHLNIDLAALLDRPPRPIDDAAVRSVVEGKRIVITGAGGSIGSELSRVVATHRPAELVLVDRSENALFEIDRQIARFHPDLPRRALLHDVVDVEATRAHLLRLRPEVVFHAAAHKHVPMMEDHPAAAVDNNLFGTKSIADAADAAGVDTFVMVSTDKAVNPTSIMGATKRLAELYVQWLNGRTAMRCAMVRFGNVLGSSGSVLEIWAQQLAEGGPLTVTHPDMTRYFMTIPEAASLVIQSAALLSPADLAEGGHGHASGGPGEVFLLDMGEPVPVVEMARRFIRQHGLEPRVMGDAPLAADRPSGRCPNSGRAAAASGRPGVGEIRIAFTGVRPGEKLFEELAWDAEALQPTRHPGIKIWALTPPSSRYIDAMLTELEPSRRPSDAAALARRVHRLAAQQPQSRRRVPAVPTLAAAAAEDD